MLLEQYSLRKVLGLKSALRGLLLPPTLLCSTSWFVLIKTLSYKWQKLSKNYLMLFFLSKGVIYANKMCMSSRPEWCHWGSFSISLFCFPWTASSPLRFTLSWRQIPFLHLEDMSSPLGAPKESVSLFPQYTEVLEVHLTQLYLFRVRF